MAVRTAQTSANGHGIAEDVAHTLDGANGQAIAFNGRMDPVHGSVTGAIDTDGATQCIAFDTTQITSAANYSSPKPGDPCHPLASGAHPPAVASALAVRRLVPAECEALQGFPRGYTKISAKTSDGPRYKALGNSFAVPVVRWIGQRIQEMEEL